MKNKELLPCPFCGGEARLQHLNANNMKIVKCVYCGLTTPAYDKEDKPIAIWNTRTNKIPVGNGENYEETHNEIKK